MMNAARGRLAVACTFVNTFFYTLTAVSIIGYIVRFMLRFMEPTKKCSETHTHILCQGLS